MRDRIVESLRRIEAEESVRILYACESGSRAWGFPSADSDYDVRFLYVRSRDWYLAVDLEERRDVIERPAEGALDVMAAGNYREYLQGPEVWVKKYFYVLRPLLAVRWIESGLGPVPMEFPALVERVVEEPAVRAAIAGLVEGKKRGDEMARGPRIETISDFIERELPRLEAARFSPPPGPPTPFEPLNDLFRGVLDRA